LTTDIFNYSVFLYLQLHLWFSEMSKILNKDIDFLFLNASKVADIDKCVWKLKFYLIIYYSCGSVFHLMVYTQKTIVFHFLYISTRTWVIVGLRLGVMVFNATFNNIYRTDSMHMTTSVSRRLSILCIKFKISIWCSLQYISLGYSQPRQLPLLRTDLYVTICHMTKYIHVPMFQ
jgi:hypothetical protein